MTFARMLSSMVITLFIVVAAYWTNKGSILDSVTAA